MLLGTNLIAQLVPSDVSVDWTQTGVSGGVPNRTTIFTNMTGLDATGKLDASSAIGAAVALAPSNSVVQIPAGMFMLSNTITVNVDGVSIRGTGTNTVLLSNSGGAAFNFVGNRWYDDQTSVANGYFKGSTNLALPAIPVDLVVGTRVHLMQSNDTSFVFPAGIDGSSGEYCIGQWLKVTGIVGTNISVWPPLYFSYSNQFAPFIKWPVNGANYAANLVTMSGVETLVISNINAGASAQACQFDNADECWISGIESYWGSIDHVWPQNTYRCEIRDSLFFGVIPTITSSRCYGIQVGTPNAGGTPSQTSGLKIENNRFELCRGAIILGYGAAGCVVDYNFCGSETNETASILRADIFVHSCFPMANLYEGNVAPCFNADRFHGNGGNSLIFRNYFAGRDSARTTVSSLRSVEIDADTHNFAVIGNVLGYPGIGNDMAVLTSPTGGALYLAAVPDTSWSYGNWYKALMFGYDGEGGGTTMDDTNVFNTTLVTGNYNYIQNQTTWNTNGVQTLPTSLIYSNKPAWFGSFTWPPIGPDVSGLTNLIPAQFLLVTIPPVPANTNTVWWLPIIKNF